MSLSEIRQDWEDWLSVVYESEQRDGRLLVILKDSADLYHCHRYFRPYPDADWQISVDEPGVALDEAFRWFEAQLKVTA